MFLIYSFRNEDIKIVNFSAGVLDIVLKEKDSVLVKQLKALLEEETKIPWEITIVDKDGTSLYNEEKKEKDMVIERVKEEPLVKYILKKFSGSEVEDVVND